MNMALLLPDQVPRGNVSTKTLTIAVLLLLIKPEDTGQSVITRSDWWV